MNEITVLTFGVVTEIIGQSNFNVKNVDTTDALKKRLETDYPGLRLINYAIAVNKQMTTTSEPLTQHDTIALLPPFSGG